MFHGNKTTNPLSPPSKNSPDPEATLNLSNDRTDESAASSYMSFPARLHRLLDNEAYHDILLWGTNGTMFAILDSEAFERIVLGDNFQGTKFNSFVRKLNRWGFRRCRPRVVTEFDATAIVYGHADFRRDEPQLLSRMKAITATKKQQEQVRRQQQLQQEHEKNEEQRRQQLEQQQHLQQQQQSLATHQNQFPALTPHLRPRRAFSEPPSALWPLAAAVSIRQPPPVPQPSLQAMLNQAPSMSSVLSLPTRGVAALPPPRILSQPELLTLLLMQRRQQLGLVSSEVTQRVLLARQQKKQEVQLNEVGLKIDRTNDKGSV